MNSSIILTTSQALSPLRLCGYNFVIRCYVHINFFETTVRIFACHTTHDFSLLLICFKPSLPLTSLYFFIPLIISSPPQKHFSPAPPHTPVALLSFPIHLECKTLFQQAIPLQDSSHSQTNPSCEIQVVNA